ICKDCPLDCKVFLEHSFGYYGPLRSVWVARNPPGFASVDFFRNHSRGSPVCQHVRKLLKCLMFKNNVPQRMFRRNLHISTSTVHNIFKGFKEYGII
uniref:Transposase Tc1-like domain-containing protein n=1 Tax=Erpetoichthys calabaricus TaxID=27687 RepID=A0A8C4SFM8_ERPCA